MDIKRLNDEGRELWNRKAEFWDALHGDTGNDFHRGLVEPSVLRLLGLRAGEAVLDIGCGNGALARRLASLGARVCAFDFSAEMLRLAKARQETNSPTIEYRLIDATDEAAMLALGFGRFDAITCAMTLMDIPTVDPLFRAAARLLRSDGRLVFATQHPAFNSNNPIFVHEKEDRDGVVSDHYAVKLRAYLNLPPVKGSGAPGESNPHYYYHRSLSDMLNAAFAAGFALGWLARAGFHGRRCRRRKRAVVAAADTVTAGAGRALAPRLSRGIVAIEQGGFMAAAGEFRQQSGQVGERVFDIAAPAFVLRFDRDYGVGCRIAGGAGCALSPAPASGDDHALLIGEDHFARRRLDDRVAAEIDEFLAAIGVSAR